MKKLVAMVLALCMLMACVPAFATLTIPETAADVPGAVKPAVPDYTLTVVDDHYVLTIDGVNGDDVSFASISGFDKDDNYGDISLTWNGSAFESSGLLDEVYSNGRELFFHINKDDGSGYYFYSVEPETGALISVSEGNWSEDGESVYGWYEDCFTYRYGTWDDGYVNVEYNSVSGKVMSYSIDYPSGITVSYNRYGKITGGHCMAPDGDFYWDSYSNCWINEVTGERNTELEPLNAENYPAPYAVPYVLYKPSADLKDLDTTEGELYELEGGNYYYWSGAVEAVYDADGKLESYSYINLEGNKSVTYDANDVLIGAWVDLPDGTSYGYDNEFGWYYYNGDEVVPLDEVPEGLLDDMDPLKEKNAPVASKVQYTWYDHNTVGLVGLSLRDMGITDKWYNVVPVDLTQDGVQVLDLVGSNLFHIGKAAVIVQDGKVSVDYDLFFGEGYVKDECVQWFTSLDDITTDFLNNPTSDVAFGQELSIADDLGGAETAILFICNHVTYRQPYNGDNGYLSRYWPNRQRWIDYRAELTELLEGMSK